MEKENTTATAQTFDGGVTEQQIEAWKVKHRRVYRVDVVDEGETHIGYFKRPDFLTIKAVTKLAKSDEVEGGKVMFDNCWLGGSDALKTDAVLFVAVQKQLAKIMTGCMGSLKNL